MAYKEKFIQSIGDLGNVKDHPLCNQDTKKKIDYNKIESKINFHIPSSYKEFYDLFGSFSFINSVYIKPNIKIPISNKNNFVSVDYFYSLDLESECSIIKLIHNYSDQLPSGLFPICDGESGDLVCINLNNENYGAVYYWWHEGYIGNELFKIADTFQDFIFNLRVIEDNVTNSQENNMKVEASPELLKMLKKSGYGPKD